MPILINKSIVYFFRCNFIQAKISRLANAGLPTDKCQRWGPAGWWQKGAGGQSCSAGPWRPSWRGGWSSGPAPPPRHAADHVTSGWSLFGGLGKGEKKNERFVATNNMNFFLFGKKGKDWLLENTVANPGHFWSIKQCRGAEIITFWLWLQLQPYIAT